jgi:Na+/proline symporter
MRRRFGERIRRFTALTFLVTRSVAEGVRVFAISLVVSVVLGTGEIASIAIITLMTLFYTFHGGMTAVIWTDVAQMLLYVTGAVLSFVMILTEIPEGWAGVLAAAAPQAKFQILHFDATGGFFAETYSFWAGLLGGCFLTTATHGTDQLIVQRLLSARSETESKLALLSSWVVIFLQFSLFLTVGVMLFVLYGQQGLAPPAVLDRLYPEYVWNHLPPIASGIVVAAILAAAMANIAAALNSLAATTVMDFLVPSGQVSVPDQARYLQLSRRVTLFWGAVLLAIGILARRWGSVLEAGLAVASVPLGALLGVFGLGILTKKVGEGAALTGMAAGLAVVLYVRFGSDVAWTWYVVIGALTTFAAGLAASVLFRGAGRDSGPKRLE